MTVIYYRGGRKAGFHLACENIRFSSLFVAEDVPHETSTATKREEKRMFSQARFHCTTTKRGLKFFSGKIGKGSQQTVALI